MKHNLLVLSCLALTLNCAYGATPHSIVTNNNNHNTTTSSRSGSQSNAGSTSGASSGSTSNSGSSSSVGNTSATGGTSSSGSNATGGNSSSGAAVGLNNNNQSAATGNGSNNPTITNSLTTENCKVAMIMSGKPYLLSLCDGSNAPVNAPVEYHVPPAQPTNTQNMVWSGVIIGEDGN